MKIRVTADMKTAFQELAATRSTAAQTVSESDLARTAFIEFLHAHAAELKESTAAALPPANPSSTPVTYGKSGSKKDTGRRILDTVKKGTKPHPVPPQPK